MSELNDDPFRFRFRVRYAECDAQSVVFNARYADFVDISVNEYIRTLFGDYQRLLDQDLDIQVVSLNLNYQAPAKFDDVLEARIRIGRIGNTSFTLHLDFMRHPDGLKVADAEIVCENRDRFIFAKCVGSGLAFCPSRIFRKLS